MEFQKLENITNWYVDFNNLTGKKKGINKFINNLVKNLIVILENEIEVDLPKNLYNYAIIGLKLKDRNNLLYFNDYFKNAEKKAGITFRYDNKNTIILKAIIDAFPYYLKTENKEKFFEKLQKWIKFYEEIFLNFDVNERKSIKKKLKKNFNVFFDYCVYLSYKKNIPVESLRKIIPLFIKELTNNKQIKGLSYWVKKVTEKKIENRTKNKIFDYLSEENKNKRNYLNKSDSNFVEGFVDFSVKTESFFNVTSKNAEFYATYKNKAVRKLENLSDYMQHNELDKTDLGINKYLFAKYEMPNFMLSRNSLFTNYFRSIDKNIFSHISEGKNLSKLEALPFKITKKEAHSFINKNEYAGKYIDLIISIKFVNLGISNNKSEILIRNIGEILYNDLLFWEDFVRLLAKSPNFVEQQISPIIDYLKSQRYYHREVVEIFTLKGKTLNSLLRAMEEWHLNLRKLKNPYYNRSWEGVEIDDYFLSKKLKPIKDDDKKDKIVFSISQLRDGKQLYEESENLKHCVSSYAQRCYNNNVSIWSLRQKKNNLWERLITIELRGNNIVQARGLHNRTTTAKERTILEKWAIKNKLKKAFYF